MNQTKQYLFIACLFFLGLSAKAQVTWPYFTGFDDAVQQSGWAEYKKAATTFSHWSYSSGGFSDPFCVSHDYSPSTGITLTDNWFVSPLFTIPAGGKLDSVRYRFSGFSQPVAGDTVALYLLTGSQDPALATSKQLLFDFRGTEYITDNTYRQKTNISLPANNEDCFIAIRYRNTDCSSKWLTVSFDNFALSRNGNAGIKNSETNGETLRVYPNPSNGIFFIDHSQPVDRVEVFDAVGNKITDIKETKASTKVDLSRQPKGLYILRLQAGGNLYTKKIIVE